MNLLKKARREELRNLYNELLIKINKNKKPDKNDLRKIDKKTNKLVYDNHIIRYIHIDNNIWYSGNDIALSRC